MQSADLKLYERFFKPDKEYYLMQLEKYESGRKLSFNFSTLSLGILWFIYRKLYIEALQLIVFIAIIAGLYFYLIRPLVGDTCNVICVLSFISILWIIIGFSANRIYIKKAKETIRIAKAKYSDEKRIFIAVSDKGGVSSKGLYISIVVFAFVIWLTV